MRTRILEWLADFKVSSARRAQGNWQAWTGQGEGTENVEVVVPIEGGDNVQRSFSVQFRDRAGNVSEACVSDTILVDTVPLSYQSLT